MGVFGSLIKKLRNRTGWSQERLAMESGISRNSILNIEHLDTPDEIRFLTIEGLARAFKTTREGLLKLYEERKAIEGRREIEIVEADGSIVTLPTDLVARLEAAAKASGKPFSTWLTTTLEKLAKPATPPLRKRAAGE